MRCITLDMDGVVPNPALQFYLFIYFKTGTVDADEPLRVNAPDHSQRLISIRRLLASWWQTKIYKESQNTDTNNIYCTNFDTDIANKKLTWQDANIASGC